MVSILPAHVLEQAQEHVSCRQHQLQQLAIYYNHYLPSPSILIAYGLDGSGKLETINALLQASGLRHEVVKSKECLSQRHLLTKIFAACLRQTDEVDNAEKYDRIDNLNSLVVNLQRMFEGQISKVVVVIDGIDKQKQMSTTLLPALARLGDMVPNLSLILTSSSSRSIPLHRPGVPYVQFPPYDRAQAIGMILKQERQIPLALPSTLTPVSEAQVDTIYKSFVTTVYDTLTAHTSSTSFKAFQQTCEKLWPRFIWPLLSGETPQMRRGGFQPSVVQWDFARLLARNRHLFQREGENALLSRLTSDPSETWTFEQLIANHENQTVLPQPDPTTSEPKQETPFLKFFSTLLLVSSYLASHTPPKHDIILFSRLSSSSTNKRKYLSSALSKSRTGRVKKTPTKKKPSASLDDTTTPRGGGDETPSKKSKSKSRTNGDMNNGEGLAGERTPKSTRLLLEKTSNIPRPFMLERVIAILRAVHPDGLPRGKGATDRVYSEMAELERLRLVVRCVDGGGRGGGEDSILEEKWRVNVGREFVVGVGRGWGVGLEGWEID